MQYRFPQVSGMRSHLEIIIPAKPLVVMHVVSSSVLSGQYVTFFGYTGAVMGAPPSGVYVPVVLVVSHPVVLTAVVPPLVEAPPAIDVVPLVAA